MNRERVRTGARRAAAQLRRRSADEFAIASVGARTSSGQVRLVPAPVFLVSYMRSGSTLLRSILDSHTRITAPLEMHLGRLALEPVPPKVAEGLAALELDARELENMLWDRVLWQQLVATGKHLVVDKTPTNTLRVERIRGYWPDARFLVLLRHPVPVLASLDKARPNLRERWEAEMLEYATALTTIAQDANAHTVRYEDLTRTPGPVVEGICDFLDVPWEPAMLDYGDFAHGPYVKGLGDWGTRINEGRVLPAEANPPAEEVPEALREACRLLGYL